MAEFKETTLLLQHRFDPKAKQHYLNNNLSVLHCHHYLTLYTQLALDAGETKLLADTAEDVFLEMLQNYFGQHAVTELSEKIELGCQYFAAMGLGKLAVDYLGEFAGKVRMEKSHVDEGWIKKWGAFDAPVNYVGRAYISALFSAVMGAGRGAYSVNEVESIVMGASQSVFNVTRD